MIVWPWEIPEFVSVAWGGYLSLSFHYPEIIGFMQSSL